MKAVFLDRGSFPKSVIIDYPDCVTQIVEFDNTQPQDVIPRIHDADIVLSNKVVLDRAAIESAKQLKLVQVMATGTNNLDKLACEENSVRVQNVDGYSAISVPEHTFSLLLALRRNLTSYLEDVKQGRWAEAEFFCFLDYPIQDLANSTMAIIGQGNLGAKVAQIAKAFSMEVIFVEHKNASQIRPGYTPFEQALEMADVVSLHCPLTENTANLLSYDEFERMKPSAVLLNTSRGGLVDEDALVDALTSHKIAAAGFDVASQEPMPADHPLQALTQLPNFLLTPHIAWASNEAMQSLVNIGMAKIQQFSEQQQ
ncbi:D-2-hydroxyacid dehydrogenase [Marinomonas pollencensis]|uniref:Glycerate dehydrogenase n=1 Tax=Marinomonas pollencensis TaxID=491954 RepID=A0A3E0DVK9_9GAMM|nr:D-2-hydroxyacid dehydrogenase [Marinomonas pollencensis]REG85679.1 glycerate dehydrogenase [Marinomonas pollencensis]